MRGVTGMRGMAVQHALGTNASCGLVKAAFLCLRRSTSGLLLLGLRYCGTMCAARRFLYL